jgi:hypothetical protein
MSPLNFGLGNTRSLLCPNIEIELKQKVRINTRTNNLRIIILNQLKAVFLTMK